MEAAASKQPKQHRITMRIPETDRLWVVVIGGGFAGLALVRELAKSEVQIVLIDKHNYHTFIPLLYQVATAGLSPADISSPLRDFLQDNKHFHFRMAKVQYIDAAKKIIITTIGLLRYDILVLASGSTTNFFGNRKIEDNAKNLREITDTIELRNTLINNFEEALQVKDAIDLETFMNIVIIGAGPSGVELAGAIGELRKHVLPKDYPELDFNTMKIIMVEGGKQVLGAMSPKSGKKSTAISTEIWSYRAPGSHAGVL
jgi:NADH dehydrogenase